MRNLESARFIRADARKAQLTLETLQLDVTDQVSVTRAVQTSAQAGRRHRRSGQQGWNRSFGAVEDYIDQELRRVFETNFFGAVRTTRTVLPAMRTRRSDTI